jgi:ParB family chromosome partitioning protein
MPKGRSRAAAHHGSEPSDSVFALLPVGLTTDRVVRQLAVDRITPNPQQPRSTGDDPTLDDLKASIHEHGVVQPVLVRARGAGNYELVAGERRWRAVLALGLPLIPALVIEVSDEQALEISVIENLQREDLSPLDEAAVFARMTSELGYSIRKLAGRLGKDKGYVENRLRLIDAPADVRALVAARTDTISHAYELMKLDDAARRSELAKQVATGDLSLARLKAIVRSESLLDEPRSRTSERERAQPLADTTTIPYGAPHADHSDGVEINVRIGEASDASLAAAREHVAVSIEELALILRTIDRPDDGAALNGVDRENMAKWLQIARNKLDNLAARLRQKGE